MHKLEIRFYQELNDFLPGEKKKKTYGITLKNNAAVKDIIESQGVPHPEVDLILVNGEPVNFEYQAQDGDRIAVYPMFEAFDISTVSPLRKKPLRNPRFILDVHLGKLARKLRLLGFDTLYENDLDDPEIADTAEREKRIVLTRDIGLLKRRKVARGYWVRSQDPEVQIKEVLNRFDLKGQISPFKHCINCNGIITPVEKKSIQGQVKAATYLHYADFYRCSHCGKVFWEGTHFPGLKKMIERYS